MSIIRENNLQLLPRDRKAVVALGNFDGVHLGHRAIFKTAIDRARDLGASAYVLTFDPLPARVLNPARAPKMILTSEDKLELISQCGVDGVIVLNFTLELSRREPRDFVRDYLLEKIGVCAIVVGHSVSFGHQRSGNATVMVELGREFGFDTTVVSPVHVGEIEVSSTRIRQLIGAGDMSTAALLLGRNHFLRGTIVHGRERGRKIGFPTANLDSQTELLPPDGVYATRVILDDGPHPAITNIGMRPTFNEPERTIEAHIFDFERDIYGRQIRLEIVERIRPERKFESAEALSRQIAQDIRSVKDILGAS